MINIEVFTDKVVEYSIALRFQVIQLMSNLNFTITPQLQVLNIFSILKIL